MDGARFDDVVRTLARSRRGALKTLAGAMLGTIAGGGERRRARAACKRVGQNCDRDGDCCAGAECAGGQCRCRAGRSECAGRCFLLDTDVQNCGACGNACAAGDACCAGQCVADFSTNPDHCGECGNACDGPRCCDDGACVDDVRSNGENCGACGNRCPVVCSIGRGRPRCRRCCADGACVADLRSNPDHCGACDRPCAAGFYCCEGHCCPFDSTCCDGVCCPSGKLCCNGRCVDSQTNRNHCGGCGHTCARGETCCVGQCTDLDADINNCGACGNNCPRGHPGIPEPLGFCCGGTCRQDANNCGACGVICPTGECCVDRCCPPLATCRINGFGQPPECTIT